MRYFIYIKNDQKRMFEQIGGVFPSIGAATKYKKQNNLSGVIISRKAEFYLSSFASLITFTPYGGKK